MALGWSLKQPVCPSRFADEFDGDRDRSRARRSILPDLENIYFFPRQTFTYRAFVFVLRALDTDPHINHNFSALPLDHDSGLCRLGRYYRFATVREPSCFRPGNERFLSRKTMRPLEPRRAGSVEGVGGSGRSGSGKSLSSCCAPDPCHVILIARRNPRSRNVLA